MRRELDVQLWKTGNSFVVTIPARLVKRWNMKEGDDLNIIIKKNVPEALDLRDRGTENVLRTNPSSKEGRQREV